MSEEREQEKEVQAAARQSSANVEPSDMEQIFQEHHNRVIQAAYRVTGNSSDAEDVLQNVFMRLLRRGEAPNTSENLGGYLHRAAVNAAIDLLRSRKSDRKVALEQVQHELAQAQTEAPDERQAALEIGDWLREAVARLSPQAAQIFALRYFEELTNQEIAEQIGTSPGVVAVVLHRARHRLQGEIRTFLGESS